MVIQRLFPMAVQRTKYLISARGGVAGQIWRGRHRLDNQCLEVGGERGAEGDHSRASIPQGPTVRASLVWCPWSRILWSVCVHVCARASVFGRGFVVGTSLYGARAEAWIQCSPELHLLLSVGPPSSEPFWGFAG